MLPLAVSFFATRKQEKSRRLRLRGYPSRELMWRYQNSILLNKGRSLSSNNLLSSLWAQFYSLKKISRGKHISILSALLILYLLLSPFYAVESVLQMYWWSIFLTLCWICLSLLDTQWCSIRSRNFPLNFPTQEWFSCYVIPLQANRSKMTTCWLLSLVWKLLAATRPMEINRNCQHHH